MVFFSPNQLTCDKLHLAISLFESIVAQFEQTLIKLLLITEPNLPRPNRWEALANELSPSKYSRRYSRFYLYTRKNPANGQELCVGDVRRLRRSHFDPNRRTIFLVNGWLDNRFFAKWVRDSISLLLIRADYNVIYVGWRSINELFVAAMLIQRYSENLSHFIDFLKVRILEFKRFPTFFCRKHTRFRANRSIVSGTVWAHSTVHSLVITPILEGLQVSFLKKHKHKPYFLFTVLDAGPRPYFEPKPYNKRINRYQAGFVDVIHSDFHPKFSLGLTIPLGDIDFYPNGGTMQTGCMRDKWYKGVQSYREDGLIGSIFQFPR